MSDIASVKKTLTGYYGAFSTLDVRAILPYFHEPALLMGPPGVVAVPDSDALAALFGPVMDGLRTRGFGRSELNLQQVRPLSATSAFASGVAIRYNTGGKELERVGVTYLLPRTGSGWKIAVLVLHDEN